MFITENIRRMLESWRSMLMEHDLHQVMRGVVTSRARAFLDGLSPANRSRIAGMMRDVDVHESWRSCREVYFTHSGMTRGLMRIKADGVNLPGSVLRNLRHINPLFITSAVPEVVHVDGLPGRILGFYTRGAISAEYPPAPGARTFPEFGTPPYGGRSVGFDTSHPDINAISVMVISEVLSSDKTRVVDHDLCHMTIPVFESFTLGGLVERVASGFAWSPDVKAPATKESESAYMATMTRLVISHLLYATSRSFEIDKGRADRPPRRSGSGKAQGGLKAATVYPVGYRMGAAIQDSRRPERTSGSGGATGRTMPAHIRSPHPHIYRVGPGRKEIEVKFLGPIPVNQQLDDGEAVTMHHMK